MSALQERAQKIVDRVLPERSPAHGFYDIGGFVERSRRRGDRSYAYWMILAKLTSKETGAAPAIRLPADCHALEGSGMVRAARALANDPALAWDNMRTHIITERTTR